MTLLFFAEPEDGRSRERAGVGGAPRRQGQAQEGVQHRHRAAVDERTPFHVVKEAVRSAGGENQNDSLLQRRLHQRRGDYVQNLNELCTIQN